MADYEVTLKFDDVEGRTTKRSVIITVADEAALIVAADAFVLVVEVLTKCGVLEYAYRRVVSVLHAPDAGSNIDPGATYRWASALQITPTTQLPDPVEAIKDGQGGMDLGNALVIAYAAEYTGGALRVNRNTPTQPTALTSGTLDK